MSKPILIYDGECPMCQRARAWVEARIPKGEIDIIPCQDARRAELAPQVPLEQCMTAMQLVLPDGQVVSGADAFPPLLRRIPRWGWLGAAMEAPGIRALSPRIYALIAKNRYSISGFFKEPTGQSCSIEKGCK